MQFVIDKISKLKIGWNERPLTEADFYPLCKRFKVSVTEMPLTVGGFYYRVMGRDFIAVDSRLAGPQKLAVLFHELGHFLLHTPESGATANFHGVGRQTRQEHEADAFALCALIPQTMIELSSLQDLIDDGFAPDMVAERLAIFVRYGF
ncbi:MAG TPA: ImmA/IrrE family metallo-endopeptidase [Pyrinomonadaceae bacterium]|nr:ImmA/IrrE family metallo-endopeptidase [Pyrinomonadaceae bacterium]